MLCAAEMVCEHGLNSRQKLPKGLESLAKASLVTGHNSEKSLRKY
jgi:hypothetical protein